MCESWRNMRWNVKIDISAVGPLTVPQPYLKTHFHYSKLITCESLWVRSPGLGPGWEGEGESVWGCDGRRDAGTDGGREEGGTSRSCSCRQSAPRVQPLHARERRGKCCSDLKALTDVCSGFLARLLPSQQSFTRRERLQAPMYRWISPGNWLTSSCWCSSQRKVRHRDATARRERSLLEDHLICSCSVSLIVTLLLSLSCALVNKINQWKPPGD